MPTNWTSVRQRYGFQSHYDFRIAIPFLLNCLGVVLVLLTCVCLFSIGALNIGTERFYFFAYLIVLLLVAAALSRSSRFSIAAFLWCALEAGMALSTNMLAVYGIGASAFPDNQISQPRSRLFMYHPLLQFAPRPNRQEKTRLNVRSVGGFSRNWPLNFAELGRDRTISHNSLGLRGAELSSTDLRRSMIFVYGGSTTYDVSVTQGKTWVERLQSGLDNKFTVLNFGGPGFSTTENLIQTAFYQDVEGIRPVCAVYYIGWNDIHNAHIQNLDRAYADWHLIVAVRAAVNENHEIWAARYSPFLRFSYRQAARWFDNLPEEPRVRGRTPVAANSKDERLEKIFVEHVSTIVAINGSRGVKTVFIGQILNRDLVWPMPKAANWWVPLVRNEDVWPLQERFNLILKEVAGVVGAGYVDAGIENFDVGDFSDPGHFSEAGSEKFAGLISKQIASYCK